MDAELVRDYRFGAFRLETAKRRLSGPDGTVPLAGRAYDVLAYLILHRNRVVGKDELLKAVWPHTVVEENNLNQAVSALRRALCDSRDAPSFIVTVAGRGYQFIGETAPAQPPKSIAILPFKPLLPDARNPALEFGVTELLVNRLSRLPGLVVAPLSSVMPFAAPDANPIDAGRRLKVEAVVDARLYVHEDRVRVTARLLDVGGGTTLWANDFTEPLGNLLAVQDTLAMELVNALAPHLSDEARSGVLDPQTRDVEAWQLYANGQYNFERRDAAGIRRAISFFDAARERDPHFALASASLADACTLTTVFGIEPPKAAFDKALPAATRAIELDRRLPAGYAALGHIETQYHRDLAAGRKNYLHALELNPRYGWAFALLALNFCQAGQLANAADSIAKAQEVEPASLAYIAVSGFIRYFARAYVDAERALLRVVDTAPQAPLPRQFLARVWLAQRQGARVARMLDGHNDPAPGAYSNLGRALAQVGDERGARAEIERLEALAPQGYGVGFDLALLHLELGERERALDALERGVGDLSQMEAYLNVEPALDALRAEPRFRSVSGRLRLG
ncbi:MAG: winged helix-turn-helix domain-containing protein [Proteobacteria bacterium]|jgi:DNA-binding winged helix-turn-helix (wHTH) protein/tetratricopeptide (TPR) repeat protein|nr:winged helix-turn-helix domain-containing protein [Pseudomonadota bacterium]